MQKAQEKDIIAPAVRRTHPVRMAPPQFDIAVVSIPRSVFSSVWVFPQTGSSVRPNLSLDFPRLELQWQYYFNATATTTTSTLLLLLPWALGYQIDDTDLIFVRLLMMIAHCFVLQHCTVSSLYKWFNVAKIFLRSSVDIWQTTRSVSVKSSASAIAHFSSCSPGSVGSYKTTALTNDVISCKCLLFVTTTFCNICGPHTLFV